MAAGIGEGCLFLACHQFSKLYSERNPSLVLGKGPLTQSCWHLLPLTPASPPESSAPVRSPSHSPAGSRSRSSEHNHRDHSSPPHALPLLLMNLQDLDASCDIICPLRKRHSGDYPGSKPSVMQLVRIGSSTRSVTYLPSDLRQIA